MVLCSLKVDCNGVLSVRPDFNKGRRPYKVGGGLTGRGTCLCETVYSGRVVSVEPNLFLYCKLTTAANAGVLASEG